jgi:hypothetical protein
MAVAAVHKPGHATYGPEFFVKIEELKAWSIVQIQEGKGGQEGKLFLLSPSTLHRYLTAHNGNVDATKAALLHSMEWRADFVKRPFSCPECVRERTSHCFIPLGYSSIPFDAAPPQVMVLDTATSTAVQPDGEVAASPVAADASIAALSPLLPTLPIDATTRYMPIVYSSQPRASSAPVEPQMHHVVHALEHTFRPEPAIHHQWIWIVDFNGWGWSHAMQARVGISMLNIFTKHMPERLGRLVMINPPSVFDIFLAAMKPFVDTRTMSKVFTVHAKGEDLVAKLTELHFVPRDMAQWIGVAAGMEAIPGNLPPLPEHCADLQMLPAPVNAA